MTFRRLRRLSVPFGEKIVLIAKRWIEWRRRGIETVSLVALRRALFGPAQLGHSSGGKRHDVGRTRIELQRPLHFDRALREVAPPNQLIAERYMALRPVRIDLDRLPAQPFKLAPRLVNVSVRR